MRWSVKEYLLKAGICQLCTGDQVGVNAALDRYRELDPSFTQQREHMLLTDLAQAVELGDQDMFSEKVSSVFPLSRFLSPFFLGSDLVPPPPLFFGSQCMLLDMCV